MPACVAVSSRFRFSKQNRVLRRADFLLVYENGRSIRRRGAVVFVAPRDQPGLPTQLGLTVTRKVGGSVERNRLKRMGREIFRLALPELKPGFVTIINFQRAALEMDYHQLREQLLSAWQAAGMLRDAV